ncbi:putative leader peptide [Pseudonocardia ammonioxydans]
MTERATGTGPLGGPGHLLTRRRHVDLLRLAGCTCR